MGDLFKMPNIHKCADCNQDIYFLKLEKWYKMNLDKTQHKCKNGKTVKTYFCAKCKKANLKYNQVMAFGVRLGYNGFKSIKGLECIDKLKCFDQCRLNRVKERTTEFKEFNLNPTVMSEHIDEQKALMIKWIKRSGLEYRRYKNDNNVYGASIFNKSNYWFNTGKELKALKI